MTYGIYFVKENNESLLDKIATSCVDKDLDAIVIVIDESIKMGSLYQVLFKKFGEDFNVYLLENLKDKMKNLSMINSFCKTHLGYDDEFKTVLL